MKQDTPEESVALIQTRHSGDFGQSNGRKEVVVFWVHFEGRAADFAVELDEGYERKRITKDDSLDKQMGYQAWH